MSVPAIPDVPDVDAPRPVARLMTVQQMEITIAKIATTELVPGHFRGRPEAILAAGIMGRELGWQLFTALRSIYVVDGRPDLMTEAKQSLATQAGHRIEEIEAVTLKGTRSPTAEVLPGRWRVQTVTVEEAERLDYGQGEMAAWGLAVERLCDRLWPDVFSDDDKPRTRLRAVMEQGGVVEEIPAATVRGTRGDTGLGGHVTYTIEDAIQAGLIGRDEDGELRARSQRGKPKPWELHTKDMLYWRATSRVCRRYLADVFSRIETVADKALQVAAVKEPEGEITDVEEVEVPELPAVTGEDVPACERGPKGVHDMRSNPWCANCDYDPAGLKAAHDQDEHEWFENVRRLVRDNPCSEAKHHEMVNRGPGYRPVCRLCGLDPAGARVAGEDRKTEIIESVEGEVIEAGGHPALWEAEMRADADAETDYQRRRREACDHSMGHDGFGWCLGCGIGHPDADPFEHV